MKRGYSRRPSRARASDAASVESKTDLTARHKPGGPPVDVGVGARQPLHLPDQQRTTPRFTRCGGDTSRTVQEHGWQFLVGRSRMVCVACACNQQQAGNLCGSHGSHLEFPRLEQCRFLAGAHRIYAVWRLIQPFQRGKQCSGGVSTAKTVRKGVKRPRNGAGKGGLKWDPEPDATLAGNCR